jgi:hypothetical protein
VPQLAECVRSLKKKKCGRRVIDRHRVSAATRVSSNPPARMANAMAAQKIPRTAAAVAAAVRIFSVA